MSQLGKHLRVGRTLKHLDVRKDVTRDPRTYTYEFRVGCQFGAAAMITESALRCADGPQLAAQTVTHLRRQLIEEMFGEFRVPLVALSDHIRTGDIQAAMTQWSSLYAQMFDDGTE